MINYYLKIFLKAETQMGVKEASFVGQGAKGWEIERKSLKRKKEWVSSTIVAP